MKRIFIAMVALPLMVATAVASQFTGAVNTAIDTVQPVAVNWISEAVWIGVAAIVGRLGFKGIEWMNRATVITAAANFANSVIDRLQERYLAQNRPEIADLVQAGVRYVKDGNPSATKAIPDHKIATYVSGALQKAAVASRGPS